MATRWFRKQDGGAAGPWSFQEPAAMLRAGRSARTIASAWSMVLSGFLRETCSACSAPRGSPQRTTK